MLKREWTLLVVVAFNTSGVRSDCELGLLRFKTAMSVMTVAALHGPFQHLVLEGLAELSFCLSVASHAQLRFALLQHRNIGDSRVLVASLAYECNGVGPCIFQW